MESSMLKEIKAAINYMEYKPLYLSKFYDIKSLLYKEIIENPEEYKVSSIFPNPLNDNKIIKCINILDKKYMQDREKIDLVRDESIELPIELKEIIKGFFIKQEKGIISLETKCQEIVDIYLNLPRGNSTNLYNIKLEEGFSIEIINIFNSYASEGFTLAFRFKEFMISIEPSSLEGIKGQGDVFIYILLKDKLYKDIAKKYFDISEILSFYKG